MKQTLVSLLNEVVEKYPDRIAVKSQISEENWTYQQLQENAYKVSGVLARLDVEKGDRVVIVSDNNPRSVAVDYGVLCSGAISVPVNQNLRPSNLYGDYFSLIQPSVILAESIYVDKLKKYSKDVPIVSFERAFSQAPFRTDVDINENDVSTIIFSSGTTSESERAFKAVQLTQNNIASNIIATQGLSSRAEKIDGFPQGVYMAGLARQWHSFEYMIQKAFLYSGCLLHFTDIPKFMKGKAAEINPNYLIMIPKVANKIMNQIKENIADRGERTNKLFEWCLEQSKEYQFEKTNKGNLKLMNFFENLVGNKFFYQNIREKLKQKIGENNPYPVGGSAPLALETALFFGAIGWRINQGYGLTETSPVISVNTPENYSYGSSGKVIEGTDVLIVDPDELDKNNIVEMSEGEQGVILTRGPNVFPGYFGDEAETKKVFVGGWFNTEDLGHMKDEFLYVGGRQKNIICLSTGEKIFADPIKTYYNAKGLNLIVVGNNQPRAGALILFEEGNKKRHLEDVCNILSDSSELFGVSFSKRNVAIVPDFYKHPELMTGTMKIRTRLAEKHYEGLVNKLCS